MFIPDHAHPGGIFIPEGCLKIAQRFNVGNVVGKDLSPAGTAEILAWFVTHFRRLLGHPTSFSPALRTSLPRVQSVGLGHKLAQNVLIRKRTFNMDVGRSIFDGSL